MDAPAAAPTEASRPAYWDAPMGGGAPTAAAPQEQAAPARPAYWDTPLGGPPEAPPPPAAPKAKTIGDRLMSLGKGAAGFGLDTAQFLNMAASTAPMLIDKVHSLASGIEQTGAQDAFFNHAVDPIVAGKQKTDLPEDADFTDKLLHGIGGTAGMIAAALASGGAAEAPAVAGIAGRAAAGIAQMSAPAAVAGLETGRRVYEATGDAKAAAIAGSTSYTLNALSGAVPMTIGGKLATRMATGAAIGPALGEAQRQVQNAAMPESMQQPFDKENAAINAVTGSLFGLLPGGHGAPEVKEVDHTIMDQAQRVAAQEELAKGGDNLDAVVAATHANTVVGAHHDAAAYEAAMQKQAIEASKMAGNLTLEGEEMEPGVPAREMETAPGQPKTTEDAAFEAKAAAEPQPPAVPENAFEQRRQSQQAQEQAVRDQAFIPARNQIGEQTVAGAEKGEAGFQAPTLADTLPAESQEALRTFAARRQAEMATERPAPTAEERVLPYVEPKGTKGLQSLQERRLAQGLEVPAGLGEGKGVLYRDANEADSARPTLTKEEATHTLQPMIDKAGEGGMQIHDSKDADTVPPHIKEEIANGNHPNPRGVYDPATGTIHVFADAHASHEDLHDTAVHEMAHKGVESFLGEDYEPVMSDIHQNASREGKAWMRDYMDQHDLDPSNEKHQHLAADEYAAHLAEHADEDPGMLRKVIDSVRGGLRKLGVVHEWTDADIRGLIRKSTSHLAMQSPHYKAAAEYKGDGLRWADKEDRLAERLSPENPLSQAHKFGKTMEEQANYNPGVLRSARDFVGEKWDKSTDSRLALIGFRNLPDFINPKLMPGTRAMVRIHDQMAGRRGRLMEDGANKLNEWSKWASKNKEKAKTLGALMHGNTLAGVDTAEAFKPRWSEEERAADPAKQAHDDRRAEYHAAAKKLWDSLDDKGREIYKTARDTYKQQRIDAYNGLKDRINGTGADAGTKQQLINMLRQKFEAGRVDAPYFPLMRFGDHWASAKDKDGNVAAFSRFESPAQKAAWLKEFSDAGYKVDGGERLDDKSTAERIDPKFVQKIMDLPGITNDLKDEIWQEYLKAMPEMSMRKQFIHRQGRLGYTMDAMRNFSYSAFHSAHQISRLEYGNRMDDALDAIREQAKKVGSDAAAKPEDKMLQKNATYSAALAREMARRYDWIKNPKSASWASALTKFGFGWYLGAAPATAFRISSQNPMIAQPMLAKYHGQIGATRELMRASAQWAMAKGDLGDTLRGDEKRAFDTAKDMGVFSSTATQMLASGGSGDPIVGPRATLMKAAAYLFNAMEHKNRMSTYLAGYRLGRAQGMSHEQAVEHATDVTWDSHFDYQNANRPRVLQNDYMKVAALFKQYSWGVTYRLAREGRDMIDSELTGDQRVQARKAFAGLLARNALYAGVTGLPLSWLAFGAINSIMGDQDRPFDSEQALHKSLEDSMGTFAADSIMKGPMGAISGASLSTGASYADLWYRPPTRDENWADTLKDGAMSIAGGAIPSIAMNMAQGADIYNKTGDIRRAAEHFLPPEASALARAQRYATQGVTNLQGESILTPEQLDNRDLFLQAIGFTPQKVADMQAKNTVIKNVEKAIMDRREQLLNNLQHAASMGDEEEMAKWMGAVDKFNKTNPGVPILGKTVVSSMMNRFKSQAQAVNGVVLKPGLQDLRDTY